jgi:hypothetical protein
MSSPEPSEGALSEAYIQDCFHSYLRSSLAQAKAERLLDVDVLASAEADLMITGTSCASLDCASYTDCQSRSCIMSLLCCNPLYDQPTICSTPSSRQAPTTSRALIYELPSDLLAHPPSLGPNCLTHPNPITRTTTRSRPNYM